MRGQFGLSVQQQLMASATALVMLVSASPAMAQTRTFDVPAQSASRGIPTLAKQAGIQIVASGSTVRGKRTNAVRGSYSVEEALRRLLEGTGLTASTVGSNGIITIQAAPEGEPPAGSAAADSESADIVVTGSHIRGEAPVGSNVSTIRRADIDRNGYSTVAQALQALPGNFGGTATPQAALTASDRTGTNASLATGVNLRGLGASATLVLLNGRRIAGAGTLGDFADLSSIPMSVVEKVEVLMDGASAIYGSDAVGGVVNIIMKDRFDGFESGARFGGATGGGLREIQAYQTAGTTWSSGSALLTYEFFDQSPLASEDRRFSRSADSRSLGGTDHRYVYSLPGNILAINPTTGALGVAYAIPSGQNGTALQPADFIAGSANLEDFVKGSYLVPQQTRHSIYAQLRQDVGDKVHLSLEGRYTHRDFDSRSAGYATILSVTKANPWFVSPTGASSQLIGYSFGSEIGPTHDSGWSETMGVTGVVDIDLSARWRFSAFGAYAQSREMHRTDNLPNEAIIAEALGTVADNPATAYSPARDGYFNPYGSGSSNNAAVLAAIGSGFNEGHYTNRVSTGNFQVDGPLMDLPAGSLSLAAGGNIRREIFQSQYTAFFYTATPSVGSPIDRGRTISAAFAEMRLPLFGASNAITGFRRLDLSVAGRVERYPDFGTTANPKFGVNWSPIDGVVFRGTYGTSFRAPNLGQLRGSSSVGSTILTNASGGSVRVIQLAGGNPDLKPERAKSWTVGVDIAPPALPGLRVSGTFFRTIFDQRIDRPAAQNLSTALTNPDLSSFVRYVSPSTNAADRDYVTAFLSKFSGGSAIGVNNVAAVVDTRYVNTASTDVRGLDFSIGYTFERGPDTFSVNANGTYLFKWLQQTTPTSTAIDRRNLSGWPTALRGRMTAGWTRGTFDAQLGLNYVGSYHDAITSAPISSWTTVDARIAWTTPKDGPLGKTTIALIGQNLFDRDPPFYDSSAGVGYDAANSDATGRYIALQITKHW